MQRRPFFEASSEEPEIYELPSWDMPGLIIDANHLSSLRAKSPRKQIQHFGNLRPCQR